MTTSQSEAAALVERLIDAGFEAHSVLAPEAQPPSRDPRAMHTQEQIQRWNQAVRWKRFREKMLPLFAGSAIMLLGLAIWWGIEAVRWGGPAVTARVASCEVVRSEKTEELLTHCRLLLPDGSVVPDVRLLGQPRYEGAQVGVIVRGQDVKDPETVHPWRDVAVAATGAVTSALLAFGISKAGSARTLRPSDAGTPTVRSRKAK
jgi:hypothetical protein